MYKCYTCRTVFDEPATYTENVGEYWGMPAYETFSMCPRCHSDDIGEYVEQAEDDE